MNIKISLTVSSFQVPEGAEVIDTPGLNFVPIDELPQEALDQLTGEWLELVYSRANKRNPWSRIATRG